MSSRPSPKPARASKNQAGAGGHSAGAASRNADAGWRSSDAIEALVTEHADLVRGIAYRMLRRIPPSIDVDDLIQTGTVGLLEAARRYQGHVGSSFPAYAAKRIRGAMLDAARRSDWCPRSLRRRMRTIEGARSRLEGRAAATARAPVIARAAGLTLDSYYRTLRDAYQAVQPSLEDPGAEAVDGAPGPAQAFERAEVLRVMNAAIQALPNDERVMFLLYYDEEWLMREIGAKFSLSESRICQIHKRTLGRLRAAMA